MQACTDLEHELESIFCEVLEVDGPLNRSDIQYNTSPKWNSLAHMSLVAAIESKFDCIMEPEDILDMSSFDKAVEIVRKYRVAD